MASSYTSVHYSQSTVHFFPAESRSSAFQYLIDQIRLGLTNVSDAMAIVRGADDEVIYYKRSHNDFKSMQALLLQADDA